MSTVSDTCGPGSSVSIAAVAALVSALPSSHPLSLSGATVLVTGVSGFVGRWLLRSLLSPALSVSVIRCLVRSAESEKVIRAVYADASNSQRKAHFAGSSRSEPAEAKVAQLEVFQADLQEEEKLGRAMQGVRHVFHLAAHTTDHWDWDPEQHSHKVNVEGTKTLLRVARTAAVHRFVHCGTEAALIGSGPIVNADEKRLLVPASKSFPYSRTKALAEIAVLAANEVQDSESASAAAGTAFSTISVRPRLVWGHGDTNILSKLTEAVRQGQWVWVSGGAAFTSSCHVLNLCEGLLLAAQGGRPGSAYFVTDGAPHTSKEFVSSLFAAVDVIAPNKSVPYSLAYAMATLGEVWCRWFGGRPSLTRQRLEVFGPEVTVNDAKARKELGYIGKVTVEDGLQQLKEHFHKFHTIRDY